MKIKHKNLGRNNPSCKYNFDDNLLGKINSHNKAYVLGWIASDGGLSNKNISIILAEKDKEILYKIRDFICKEIPIKLKKIDIKNRQDQFRLTISSKTMVNDVCKWLCISPACDKTAIVKFPEIEKRFICDFIRGYFDGDGNIRSIDKNCKKGLDCNITSKSQFIKDSIQTICSSKGIYSNVNKDGIYFSTFDALRFLDMIYKGGKMHLQRKFIVYKKWKNRVRTKKTYMCEKREINK